MILLKEVGYGALCFHPTSFFVCRVCSCILPSQTYECERLQSVKCERFFYASRLVHGIILVTNGKRKGGQKRARNGGNIVNELMITLLENNWFLYATCGAAGTGGLIQIVLSVIYNRSLNASDRMRNTKVAWLRQMKTRYESGYEWNNRIRNIELFVDKNMGRRKWLGIYLKTWEEFGGMMLPLTLVFAFLGAVCAGTYMEEKTLSVSYLAMGTVLAVLLRGIIVMANLKEKQNLLRTNLCDYFENTLRAEAKNRHREKREQEEYFAIKKQREEIASALAVDDRKADAGEKTNGEAAEQTFESKSLTSEKTASVQLPQKPEREERRKQRRESKKNAKEVKRLKKQEKKTEKETAKLRRKQMKEQKRVDRLAKRMEKMQQRLGTAATAEHGSAQNAVGNKKEESARLKREQLKRKVDVTPAQEDQILSEVLREFLA